MKLSAPHQINLLNWHLVTFSEQLSMPKRKEIIKWCEEYNSTNHFCFGYSYIEFNSRYETVFYFEDKNDAILAKLIWFNSDI